MTDGGAGAIELCTSISPVPPSSRELLLAADLMLRSVGFTCHRADASLGGPHFAASRPIRARSHPPPVARLALMTLPRLQGGDRKLLVWSGVTSARLALRPTTAPRTRLSKESIKDDNDDRERDRARDPRRHRECGAWISRCRDAYTLTALRHHYRTDRRAGLREARNAPARRSIQVSRRLYISVTPRSGCAAARRDRALVGQPCPSCRARSKALWR